VGPQDDVVDRRRDGSGALGVAVSSRFFAVGALCAFERATPERYRRRLCATRCTAPAALDALSSGEAPDAIVAALTRADEGRAHRQLHMIDAEGRIGQHTGGACIGWCGHLAGAGFSVAGNMLAGAAVIEETARRYRSYESDPADSATPFALRLIRALRAGEDAGGDKRGKQAAALLVYTTESYPVLDLRVDDHTEPLVELERLYEKAVSASRHSCHACRRTATTPASRTGARSRRESSNSRRRTGHQRRRADAQSARSQQPQRRLSHR
jgi:uncharacterized Ntn-hydrolase superfamily protein